MIKNPFVLIGLSFALAACNQKLKSVAADGGDVCGANASCVAREDVGRNLVAAQIIDSGVFKLDYVIQNGFVPAGTVAGRRIEIDVDHVRKSTRVTRSILYAGEPAFREECRFTFSESVTQDLETFLKSATLSSTPVEIPSDMATSTISMSTPYVSTTMPLYATSSREPRLDRPDVLLSLLDRIPPCAIP